ncbi:spore gernimation protein [Photobacterium sp. 2_MG-2023]|uniref:spore gernimation protein n=1 Tax=Photobacterium sp. 2_MG-2023 TaxID=3062663 RepID=UPI0026E17F3B|nr:spore gernimation protein [Photobacterium sp. 2_MG-2023]MDO6582385.1 spore gernimation protein [Photobacterium sp. 2_MG-2023]
MGKRICLSGWAKCLIVLMLGWLFLMGCSEALSVSATPVKGVDRIEQQEQSLDVYCSSGICSFGLESNQKVTLSVNMFYGTEQPFTKIEGVSVTGESGGTLKMVGQHQFTIEIAPQNIPVSVQVVDYYR